MARPVADEQASTMHRLGEHIAREKRCAGELDARVDALRSLNEERVPYLVAGAYAFFEYTGVFRDTKDLDVVLRRQDLDHALGALDRAGFRTELLDPIWIAKGYRGDWFVDLIFSSGNGVAVVDDGWFQHARRGDVMGVPVLLAPPEEIIWSKAYVCERERYDGNDVSHLVLACGDEMSWDRLVARFDEHWEVLLAHLLMFRFSFPCGRSKVPDWVMRELLRRTWEGMVEGNWKRRVCRGPLLSKVQYRHLLEHLGYEDAREVVRDDPGAREDRPPAEGGQDGAAVSPGSAG
jgi:hypothetical protein